MTGIVWKSTWGNYQIVRTQLNAVEVNPEVDITGNFIVT